LAWVLFFVDKAFNLWSDSGIANMQVGQAAMIAVGILLLYLAMAKRFEPLLLLPIEIGCILVNIPGAGLYAEPLYALKVA
jgi:Na+-transporting methylmalonyl-CoA/oxaloacetate decarboxylase beta subunit